MQYDGEVVRDRQDVGNGSDAARASAGTLAGEALTYEIIGAAQKVHRCLGPGFKEMTYHKAMERELILRGVPFESKRSFQVIYC